MTFSTSKAPLLDLSSSVNSATNVLSTSRFCFESRFRLLSRQDQPLLPVPVVRDDFTSGGSDCCRRVRIATRRRRRTTKIRA